MLTGRQNEIKYLEGCYERDTSLLMVCYGRSSIGKTSLLMDFVKDKNYTYYLARPASLKLQLELFSKELDCEPSWNDIFSEITKEHCRKTILIIDEFQNMVKGNEGFMEQLLELIHKNWNNQPVMVILSSSDSSWVENDMVDSLGQAAYEISGFLKVKELSFLELVRSFPKASFEDAVGIYSVLGGVPGYWQYFSDKLSFKENVCRVILSKNGQLFNKAQQEIFEKLREPQVYYTLLSKMASGEDKLNDLYASTGFSRAKISVYLKNLIELEIVEKIYSAEGKGHENSRKGIYRISNRLIHFYFRYMYPNLSVIQHMNPFEYYDKYIADDLRSFESEAFKEICREFITLMNQAKQLPFEIENVTSWCGKVGDIDIIAPSSDEKHLIAGVCCWDKDYLTYNDYEWLEFCLKMAKLEATDFYLFSGGSFDDKLRNFAASHNNIRLIDPTLL